MDISIGLPDHVPDVDPAVLVEWARRAEARGFSAVVVTDRLRWSTPEPLTVLAAIAGATRRIGLTAGVLLAPLRANRPLLVKAITTLDRIAGPGRVRLGLAPGLRKDDFEAAGVDFHTRGAQLDALLRHKDELPPLLFGGASAHTVRRVVDHEAGWIAGGLPLPRFEAFADGLRNAWAAAGRPGTPWLVDTVNFALGPNPETALDQVISAYYAFLGPEFVRMLLGAALPGAERVTASVAAHRGICDELVLVANAADPQQVDDLADLLGW